MRTKIYMNMQLNNVEELDFLITISNGQKLNRTKEVYALISADNTQHFWILLQGYTFTSFVHRGRWDSPTVILTWKWFRCCLKWTLDCSVTSCQLSQGLNIGSWHWIANIHVTIFSNSMCKYSVFHVTALYV